MRLTQKGFEPIDVDVAGELWMIISRETAVPNIVYAAPANTPSLAYKNAGEALGEPPYTVAQMKKLGYKAEKVMIVARRK